MKRLALMLALALFVCAGADAQNKKGSERWAVGTNLIDYINFGTFNIEGSVAVNKHITVNASGRYNPWTFRKYERETQMENRVQQYALGIRVWPWHCYSGWWVGARAQYQEYNRGGIRRRLTEEGDAFGIGLSAGYTFMLHKNLNMEFGIGAWGGYKSYVYFEYPRYGKVLETGTKWFVMPNDLLVSLVYIF